MTFFKLLNDNGFFYSFLFCIGLSILGLLFKGNKVLHLLVIWVPFYFADYLPCKEKHKNDLDKLGS